MAIRAQIKLAELRGDNKASYNLGEQRCKYTESKSVKDTIAKQDGWSLRTKAHAVDVYICFLKMLGRKWEPPRYKPVKKLPFIPLEEELDALISGCNKKTAALL